MALLHAAGLAAGQRPSLHVPGSSCEPVQPFLAGPKQQSAGSVRRPCPSHSQRLHQAIARSQRGRALPAHSGQPPGGSAQDVFATWAGSAQQASQPPAAHSSPVPSGPRCGRSGPCAAGTLHSGPHGWQPGAKQFPARKSSQEQATGGAPGRSCVLGSSALTRNSCSRAYSSSDAPPGKCSSAAGSVAAVALCCAPLAPAAATAALHASVTSAVSARHAMPDASRNAPVSLW